MKLTIRLHCPECERHTTHDLEVLDRATYRRFGQTYCHECGDVFVLSESEFIKYREEYYEQ